MADLIRLIQMPDVTACSVAAAVGPRREMRKHNATILKREITSSDALSRSTQHRAIRLQ